MGSPETTTIQSRSVDRGYHCSSKNLASIKIKKETADLLKIYCAFNRIKMIDFASSAIEKEMALFRNRLSELRDAP